MSAMPIERAIKNAAASVEIEGFCIDAECREWCRLLLEKKITLTEYIELVKNSSKTVKE